jgi:outer membrane protein assembly factor BamD
VHKEQRGYLKALINFNRELGFIDRYIPSDATQRDALFTQTSYLNFEELLRRFPDSKYAPDVKGFNKALCRC